jgi:hypothetical protein
MEYALIFSIRTGIEEVARQVSRTRLSTNGDAGISGTSAGGVSADILTRLYDLLLGVVGNGNMENVTVCTKFTKEIVNFVPLPYYVSAQCEQFSNARPVYTSADDANLPKFGNTLDYVAARITYTHQYLTPLGALATGLGSDLQMTSFIYFKRED